MAVVEEGRRISQVVDAVDVVTGADVIVPAPGSRPVRVR